MVIESFKNTARVSGEQCRQHADDNPDQDEDAELIDVALPVDGVRDLQQWPDSRDEQGRHIAHPPGLGQGIVGRRRQDDVHHDGRQPRADRGLSGGGLAARPWLLRAHRPTPKA